LFVYVFRKPSNEVYTEYRLSTLNFCRQMTLVMSLRVYMGCMDLSSKAMTDKPGIRTNDKVVNMTRNLQNVVDVLRNKNSILCVQPNRKCGL
jgi:hypothetical protein